MLAAAHASKAAPVRTATRKKTLRSPRQPLAAEQMGAVRASAKEQWLESLASGDATMWQSLASSAKLRGDQRALVSAEAAYPNALQPLWRVGEASARGRLRPLPRQAIEGSLSAATGSGRARGDHRRIVSLP